MEDRTCGRMPALTPCLCLKGCSTTPRFSKSTHVALGWEHWDNSWGCPTSLPHDLCCCPTRDRQQRGP